MPTKPQATCMSIIITVTSVRGLTGAGSGCRCPGSRGLPSESPRSPSGFQIAHLAHPRRRSLRCQAGLAGCLLRRPGPTEDPRLRVESAGACTGRSSATGSPSGAGSLEDTHWQTRAPCAGGDWLLAPWPPGASRLSTRRRSLSWPGQWQCASLGRSPSWPAPNRLG